MRKRRKHDTIKQMEVIVFDVSYVPDPARGVLGAKEIFVSFGVLLAVIGIMSGSILSAFSIRASAGMLILGAAAYCLFFAWFFMERWLDGKRFFAVLLLIVIYGVICFILQDEITAGFYQTANFVIRKINQAYAGNLNTYAVKYGSETTVFLLTVLFPLTGLLGAGLVRKQKWLPIVAILFPLIALTAVTGGSPSVIWLYLSLIGLVVIFSATRNRLPGWKSAAAVALISLCVSIPAWYVVRPLLSVPAASFSKAGSHMEMRIMQSLWQALPRISGGNLNLSIEGVGGGVEDGTLGEIEGYFFTGVDALKVTSAQKPQETVYLKGFVGESYTGNSFEAGDEKSFSSASSSWRVEGNASIYVENLPFLRMMYYENYSGGDETDQTVSELTTTANTITVENLNANTMYTYVPYNAFLNDNYQIYGGDGYVGGQTKQDDIFSCYWRSSYKETMERYRDSDNSNMVLNTVEKSYRSYCSLHDLEVPEEGLETLKEECEKKKKEEKWGQSTLGLDRPDWDIADEYEEIRQYVVKRLLSECEYELDVDKLPDGEDFVENFLYDTKEGYSMHFAAAATMMFRLFGVPARYVVGYAAPKEIFTKDASGNYTATLEDDNAHAWVEIYEPFLGWMPVEVTPGMEAEVIEDEDPEENGAQAVSQTEDESELTGDEEKGFHFRFKLPDWLTQNLDGVILIVQVLLALGIIISFTKKIVVQRKLRLGLGKDSTGQVRALYHSIYQMLVLAGMPEEYTAADGQVMKQLCQKCPAFTEEDAVRLQNMVLMANYGCQEQTPSDAQWMLRVYKQTSKATWRQTGIRKRVKYLVSGE